MTTGADILRSAVKARHIEYSTAGARCDPFHQGSADCSGLVSFAMNDNGIYNACGNSTGIETWCTTHGGVYVSRQFALTHPGVCLAKWGTSAAGHIKLSTGDGGSFGTPSDECHCAGYERFDARGVDRYFTIPGVDYEGGATPPVKVKETNGMIAVETNRGTAWIYDGVRITPMQAFAIAGGARHISTPQIAYDRGRVGQNPDTGQNDIPQAISYVEGRSDSLDARIEEWGAYLDGQINKAVSLASQADDRAGRIQDKLGISDP